MTSLEGITLGGLCMPGVIGVAEERWVNAIDITVDDVNTLLAGLAGHPHRQGSADEGGPSVSPAPASPNASLASPLASPGTRGKYRSLQVHGITHQAPQLDSGACGMPLTSAETIQLSHLADSPAWSRRRSRRPDPPPSLVVYDGMPEASPKRRHHQRTPRQTPSPPPRTPREASLRAPSGAPQVPKRPLQATPPPPPPRPLPSFPPSFAGNPIGSGWFSAPQPQRVRRQSRRPPPDTGDAVRLRKEAMNRSDAAYFEGLEGRIGERLRLAAASRVFSTSYDEGVSHARAKRWASCVSAALSLAAFLRTKRAPRRGAQDLQAFIRLRMCVARFVALTRCPDAQTRTLIAARLQAHPFLSSFFLGWRSGWLHAVARRARPIFLAAGTLLASPGDWVLGCHVLLSGKVACLMPGLEEPAPEAPAAQEQHPGGAGGDAEGDKGDGGGSGGGGGGGGSSVYPASYDGASRSGAVVHFEALWFAHRARHAFRVSQDALAYHIPASSFQRAVRMALANAIVESPHDTAALAAAASAAAQAAAAASAEGNDPTPPLRGRPATTITTTSTSTAPQTHHGCLKPARLGDAGGAKPVEPSPAAAAPAQTTPAQLAASWRDISTAVRTAYMQAALPLTQEALASFLGFASLPEGGVRRILESAEACCFPPGATLCTQDARQDNVAYVIVEGSAAYVRQGKYPGTSRCIYRKSGEVDPSNDLARLGLGKAWGGGGGGGAEPHHRHRAESPAGWRPAVESGFEFHGLQLARQRAGRRAGQAKGGQHAQQQQQQPHRNTSPAAPVSKRPPMPHGISTASLGVTLGDGSVRGGGACNNVGSVAMASLRHHQAQRSGELPTPRHPRKLFANMSHASLLKVEPDPVLPAAPPLFDPDDIPDGSYACGRALRGGIVGVACLAGHPPDETVVCEQYVLAWKVALTCPAGMPPVQLPGISEVYLSLKSERAAALVTTPEFTAEYLVETLPIFRRMLAVQPPEDAGGAPQGHQQRLLCPTLKDQANLMISLKPFFNDLLKRFRFCTLPAGAVLRDVAPRMVGWCSRGVLSVTPASQHFATGFRKDIFTGSAFGEARATGKRFHIKSHTSATLWTLHLQDIVATFLKHVEALPVLGHIILGLPRGAGRLPGADSPRAAPNATRMQALCDHLLQHADAPPWFKLECAEWETLSRAGSRPTHTQGPISGVAPRFAKYVLDTHSGGTLSANDLPRDHPLVVLSESEVEADSVKRSLAFIKYDTDAASSERRVGLYRRLGQLRSLITKLKLVGVPAMLNPTPDDAADLHRILRLERLMGEADTRGQKVGCAEGVEPRAVHKPAPPPGRRGGEKQQPRQGGGASEKSPVDPGEPRGVVKRPKGCGDRPKGRGGVGLRDRLLRFSAAVTGRGKVLQLTSTERRNMVQQRKEANAAQRVAILKDLSAAKAARSEAEERIGAECRNAGFAGGGAGLFSELGSRWGDRDLRTGLVDYLTPASLQAEQVHYTSGKVAPPILLSRSIKYRPGEGVSVGLDDMFYAASAASRSGRGSQPGSQASCGGGGGGGGSAVGSSGPGSIPCGDYSTATGGLLSVSKIS